MGRIMLALVPRASTRPSLSTMMWSAQRSVAVRDDQAGDMKTARRDNAPGAGARIADGVFR